MTRNKFQTLRDRHLTDPVEQALVAEMGRASRLVTTLAHVCTPECETAPDGAADGPQSERPRIADADSLFLATLKDGVEELGGRLEVVAVFSDRRVPLLE